MRLVMMIGWYDSNLFPPFFVNWLNKTENYRYLSGTTRTARRSRPVQCIQYVTVKYRTVRVHTGWYSVHCKKTNKQTNEHICQYNTSSTNTILQVHNLSFAVEHRPYSYCTRQLYVTLPVFSPPFYRLFFCCRHQSNIASIQYRTLNARHKRMDFGCSGPY